MKKLIIFSIYGLFCIAMVQGQKSDSLQNCSYRIKYVFNGVGQTPLDSTFALQYTFPTGPNQRFRTIVMEDSRQRKLVNLSTEQKQNSMEVRHEKKRIIVLVYNYDKYDLPVPVTAVDSTGKTHPLFLQDRKGSFITSDQFKARIARIREAERKNTLQQDSLQQIPAINPKLSEL